MAWNVFFRIKKLDCSNDIIMVYSIMQTELLLLSFLYTVHPNPLVKTPPDPLKAALMARYLVRSVDWVALGTISTQKAIKGYPFVSIMSMSEGTNDNSTGVPYFYITDLDFPSIDSKVDNRVSVMASMAETNFCRNKNFDQEDPRCPRVLMSGRLVTVDESSPEHNFGMNALYTKHPQMEQWPKNHNFKLSKVDLEQIELFDAFGGAKLIKPSDYFNPKISQLINANIATKLS